MSAMSENRGFVIGPEARVCLVRRHDGYAVGVVLDEGPFSHEEAEEVARQLRHRHQGKLTKVEAAHILGITPKGVDYLRNQGALAFEKLDSGKVLISADSVHAEYERRNG